jgi:hypothetical protein
MSPKRLLVFLFVSAAIFPSLACPASSPGGGPGSKSGGAGGGAGHPTGGNGGSIPANSGGIGGATNPPIGGTGSATGGSAGSSFGIATRASVQTCKPPADPARPVAQLSATGCVDAQDAKKPAASLIPFDVNSPLWSDGADKQRFLALPDGGVIHVKDCAREPDTCKPMAQGGTTPDEGHWILPVGTVLVKNFLFAGRFHETRLFIRFDDMWYGFSYRWNAAQTDADLVNVDDGLTVDVLNAKGTAQSWYYPKQNECFECHNATVGGSIGLDTRQLDRSLRYPSGIVANQIATLEHIGAFDVAPIARLIPLTDLTKDAPPATLDARARSYLHANCATCHRAYGNYSAIDLRVDVPLGQMGICNADPNKSDLGVTGAKRLVPAMPDMSLMLIRMQRPDKASGRMPQLATSVLDTDGINLVSGWINSITACP